MQSWNLPKRKAFHVGRYGLWRDIIWTRQFVSMTTRRIFDVICMVYGDERSEGSGAFLHSTLQFPKVAPSLRLSVGRKNPPIGLLAGLT